MRSQTRNSSPNIGCYTLSKKLMERLFGIARDALTRFSSVEIQRARSWPFLPKTVLSLWCIFIISSPVQTRFHQTSFIMDSKGKPSLPHLSTNFPLLEQPPNAKIAAPVPERPRRTSSLFKEDAHDENIAPIPQPGCKPIFVAQKGVEHAPITKMKKLYYDDAFTTRGSHNSPTDRVTFESIVVAELKINTRVRLTICSIEPSH